MIRTLVRLIAFTLVCLLFTAWLAFTIGNIQPFADRYELSATFDDVTGLIVNDNVKIAGVVVGKVTGIEVDQGKAVVTFSVDDDVRLPADTETAVRWRNLLGQRYIYLYPGSERAVLEGGAVIPLERARPIVDLGELFNRLGPIVQALEPDKANQFLEAVSGALEDGNDTALGDAIGDLGTFAATLGSRDEAIGRLVGNLADLTDAVAARDQQLRVILDNVTELAATFNENTDLLDSAVVDLGAFSDALGRLLADNQPGIERIITRVGEVVGVVDGRLDEVKSTVAGLDELGLSLFNAARYGEWLNQFIPCIVVDVDGPEGPIPPLENIEECTSSGGAGSASSNSPAGVAGILADAVGVGAR